MKGYCNMHGYILKPYEVDVLQRMKEPLLKEQLPKVNKNPMYEQGMTMVELIITLAVLAILVALAAPSFTRFVNSNRVTTATNDLIASLNLARTEAIKRNGAVLMRSKNGSANWAGGHRIGVDLNGDGDVLDTVSGQDELLRDIGGPHATVTITSASSALSQVSFNANGEVTTATTFTVDSTQAGVCDRKVKLSVAGSTALTVSKGTCP